MDQLDLIMAPIRFQLRLLEACTAVFMNGANQFRSLYAALPDPWTLSASNTPGQD